MRQGPLAPLQRLVDVPKSHVNVRDHVEHLGVGAGLFQVGVLGDGRFQQLEPPANVPEHRAREGEPIDGVQRALAIIDRAEQVRRPAEVLLCTFRVGGLDGRLPRRTVQIRALGIGMCHLQGCLQQ